MDQSRSFFKSLPRWLVLGALTTAGIAATSPARADDDGDRPSRGRHGAGSTHIAVDFDFGSALDAPGTKAGGGGALRLGQKFDLLLISLTPELGGSYHSFGGDDQTKIYSGFLGGRLGVGKIIEPSIFGHLGLGHVDGLETRTAPIMDAGLAIDFTLLPLIDLGLHAGYNVMLPRNDGTALKFVTLGAQAALVL
jgi:hypothetical protein